MQHCAIGAANLVKRALLAEVAKKIDEAANSRAAICIGARRHQQKPLVGVGGLFVVLGTGGGLPEVKDVIRLVGVDSRRPPQSGQTIRHSVLIKVHHRQTADGHRIVAFQSQRLVKFVNRKREVSGAQQD